MPKIKANLFMGKEFKPMEKPLSLKRKEFINNLVQLINNAEIPMFVIETILQSTLAEVHNASIKQAQQEEQAYNKACEEEMQLTEEQEIVQDNVQDKAVMEGC